MGIDASGLMFGKGKVKNGSPLGGVLFLEQPRWDKPENWEKGEKRMGQRCDQAVTLSGDWYLQYVDFAWQK